MELSREAKIQAGTERVGDAVHAGNCGGLASFHFETMRLCSDGQGFVVGSHDEIGTYGVPPQKCRCQMNRVERAKFSWRWLSGTVEYAAINLNEFERVNQRKNRRASPRDFDVGKIYPKSDAIQGAQTLDRHQHTRHTAFNIAPLGYFKISSMKTFITLGMSICVFAAIGGCRWFRPSDVAVGRPNPIEIVLIRN
jgi:hypothetical protein